MSASSEERGGVGSATTTRVRCCCCGERFAVNASRRVAACSECGTRQGVGDLLLQGLFETATLRTTGGVTVDRGAVVSVGVIEAAGPVTVRGTLEGEVRTLGRFAVERTGTWRGRARANAARIHKDAVAEGPIAVGTQLCGLQCHDGSMDGVSTDPGQER